MNAVRHLVSSAAGGAAVGAATGSPEIGTAFFIAGWAIDLDHALDFSLKWGPREAFLRMARMGIGPINRPDTAILFLHAYEVSVLLFALAAAFPESSWILGAALGQLFHLLLDQTTNLRKWGPTYFLGYRWSRRFRLSLCFPGQTPDREHRAQTVTADLASESGSPSSPSGS